MGRPRKWPIKTGECSVCDVKAHTHYHHIWERADGGPHALYNIIEICANCHALHHHSDTLDIIKIHQSTLGKLLEYRLEGKTEFKVLKRP